MAGTRYTVAFEYVSAVAHPRYYRGDRPRVRASDVRDEHWTHVQRTVEDPGEAGRQYEGLVALERAGELIRNVVMVADVEAPPPPGGYGNEEVHELADVIADAYMRGIRYGASSLARAILDAGWRRGVREMFDPDGPAPPPGSLALQVAAREGDPRDVILCVAEWLEGWRARRAAAGRPGADSLPAEMIVALRREAER